MNGPNKTAAAFRNRKWSLISEESFNYLTQAENRADELNANKAKNIRVRVTSYKLGPRNGPVRMYMVRVYES